MGRRFTETLGQYLKRERESRSMSLEELSRATRIGLPFLEALERDNFGFFSRPEFILGFLRGYARHLGLEVEEVLRRYRIQEELTKRKENYRQMPLFPQITGAKEEPPDPDPDFPEIQQPQERKRSYRNIFLQIIIVSVALGLSLYIHRVLMNSETGKKAPDAGGPSVEKVGKESHPPETSPGLEEEKKGASVQKKGGIVANRAEKVYYLPGTEDYGKLDSANRVEFESEEEALKAGYRIAPR